MLRRLSSGACGGTGSRTRHHWPAWQAQVNSPPASSLLARPLGTAPPAFGGPGVAGHGAVMPRAPLRRLVLAHLHPRGWLRGRSVGPDLAGAAAAAAAPVVRSVVQSRSRGKRFGYRTHEVATPCRPLLHSEPALDCVAAPLFSCRACGGGLASLPATRRCRSPPGISPPCPVQLSARLCQPCCSQAVLWRAILRPSLDRAVPLGGQWHSPAGPCRVWFPEPIHRAGRESVGPWRPGPISRPASGITNGFDSSFPSAEKKIRPGGRPGRQAGSPPQALVSRPPVAGPGSAAPSLVGGGPVR